MERYTAPPAEYHSRGRNFRTVHSDDGAVPFRSAAAARLLVGVEGSNLINLCFCPPGARFVLLLPRSDVIPYIPFICQAAGLELAIVAAAPESPFHAPVFPLTAVRAALDWGAEKSFA